jgi:hypothetical protein
MDAGYIFLVVVYGAMLIAGAVYVAISIFAHGRLMGIEETLYKVTSGIGSHYERAGEPIPEPVATCIDKMKAIVAKARNAREKCAAYNYHVGHVGDVTGEASLQAGFDAGRRFYTTPSEGNK